MFLLLKTKKYLFLLYIDEKINIYIFNLKEKTFDFKFGLESFIPKIIKDILKKNYTFAAQILLILFVLLQRRTEY